jgi:galactose mutarotase-like enzyme
MPVESFGPSSRGPVHKLVLGSPPGPVLEVLDLGATVHRLWVTDRDGVRRNVVLGHSTAEEHLVSKDFVGGTIGRYANRIEGARFELDGRAVEVAANEGENQLHGGPIGFDKQLWDVLDATDARATLRLASPDGDQGFPGTVTVHATFSVGDTVQLDLQAVTDADTVVGLTSHTYFNLDGDDTIDGHRLLVSAAEYLATDPSGIPLDRRPVADQFDLRELSHLRGRTLDHCFVLDGSPATTLVSDRSGIRMDLVTDQPGLQVYTGDGFDGTRTSTTGTPYGPRAGVALEAQLFPDTPNRPAFGSAVLRPGETYRSHIEWRFGPTL